MPKPSLVPAPAVTTTAATELEVKPHVRLMLKERCEEYARISREAAAIEARKKRIQGEVDQLLTLEGQGEKLLDGINIDGHKVKMVCGTTKTLNKASLMRAFGLDQSDLDEHTDEKPKRPYVKITPPGAKDEDE